MSNWDDELLMVGSIESARKIMCLSALKTEKDERIRQIMQKEIESASEAYKYWRRWVLYQEALDYASK